MSTGFRKRVNSVRGMLKGMVVQQPGTNSLEDVQRGDNHVQGKPGVVPEIKVTDTDDHELHRQFAPNPKLAFYIRDRLYHWATPEPKPKERKAFFIRLRSGIGMLMHIDEQGISLHHESNLRKTWIPYSGIKKISTPSWEQCRVFITTTQQQLVLFTTQGENHALVDAIKHRMAVYKKMCKAGEQEGEIEYLPPPPIFAITGRTMKWWEHNLATPKSSPASSPRQSREDLEDAPAA